MVPITAEQLGSASFRSQHGVRLAYAAGAMVKSIASEAMVLRLARAGLMVRFTHPSSAVRAVMSVNFGMSVYFGMAGLRTGGSDG